MPDDIRRPLTWPAMVLPEVRAHLGPEQFGRAHAEGMALSSDQVLDLASGKVLPAASGRTT